MPLHFCYLCRMIDLFFPLRCIHCEERCSTSHAEVSFRELEKHLCETCLRILSRTEPPDPEQLLERLMLSGNFDHDHPIRAAYTFQKQGPTQAIIHHFKFFGMPRLARKCGRILARSFEPDLQHIDCILPVPLHRTRISTRGYNQSEYLAFGMSDVLSKPILGQRHSKRLRPTESQTKLSIEERRDNVKGAFGLRGKTAEMLKDKRVLVIDDVLTTGATIASFGEAVQEAKPKSIQYLAFAVADFD
jgi:ComF family protein